MAPMALVVCNFAKPVKKTPALLSHDEIQTLFHEFGHALHHILSKTKHASHFGVSVA
jgi:Zn-dependent oligopeptidase